ncbi:MAG: VanZ family protein [Acutalibacteraceae bacterium]|nr:VanZ family protein [Acutalibacteraceae bacterium]
MSHKYLKITETLLYLASFACLAAMAAHIFGIVYFAHGEKIIAGFSAVVCVYAASEARAKGLQGNKRKALIKNTLTCIFVFYIMVLVDFTLIDDSLGRNIFNIYNWSKEAFDNYLRNNINLIPFATVRLFINAIKNDALPISAVLENLLGNLVAFMPLPFFLTVHFKYFSKWHRVFVAVLLSVILVETLQFVFLTGSSDIDDVILNTGGAMLMYGFLKTKTAGEIVNRLTFGLWEENNGQA